jgi:hypothetical protein
MLHGRRVAHDTLRVLISQRHEDIVFILPGASLLGSWRLLDGLTDDGIPMKIMLQQHTIHASLLFQKPDFTL